MSSRSDVVCDAGPLITLGKLKRLEVLAELYGEVRIPSPVYDEVVTSGLAKGASDPRFRSQNEKVCDVRWLPLLILRLRLVRKPYYYCA